MVCTKQIQFWTPAAVTFGILYILCTLNGVLRLILGDRFILMCRSWYSGVDLIKFQGQSKLFSHIFFCVFSGIIRPLRPKKKKRKKKKKKEPSMPDDAPAAETVVRGGRNGAHRIEHES